MLIVSNMSLPENCSECVLNHLPSHTCFTNMSIITNYITRPKECPLVEYTSLRGKWVQNDIQKSIVQCDNCGFSTDSNSYFSFCPKCGADMRDLTDDI